MRRQRGHYTLGPGARLRVNQLSRCSQSAASQRCLCMPPPSAAAAAAAARASAAAVPVAKPAPAEPLLPPVLPTTTALVASASRERSGSRPGSCSTAPPAIALRPAARGGPATCTPLGPSSLVKSEKWPRKFADDRSTARPRSVDCAKAAGAALRGRAERRGWCRYHEGEGELVVAMY